jgi:PPM family protein phosphatase
MSGSKGFQMRITAYAATDVGRHRELNEDNLYAGTTVFAVADGMGGHAAGEVASAAALRPIAALDGQEFSQDKAATDALREAVKAANREVVSEAREDPGKSGMGTTLTAVIVRDGQLHLGHVGDSRAYLLRGAEAIDQLTTDHTLVEQLVQDGRLSRDEIATHPQRSVITRAIGVDNEVEVDTLAPLVLQPGDQLLLCSDGLTGPVSDEEITSILLDEPDGDTAVQRLIDAANEHGGPDNITVVLLRVEDDGSPRAAATDHPDEAAGDPAEQPTVSLGPPPRSIPIRTRPESAGHDWATDMGRYGDRQGVESGTGLEHPRTGRRILAIITGVVILLGILAAGGYLLLSRAYFVGASASDTITIYNGLPQDVAGVPLHRELEDSGLPLSGLPAHQQERIRNGITFPSRAEADSAVEGYRNEISNPVEVGPHAPEPTETPAP